MATRIEPLMNYTNDERYEKDIKRPVVIPHHMNKGFNIVHKMMNAI